jgi:prepilin-type N-terminal cleavage/methylation domain-containing protein
MNLQTKQKGFTIVELLIVIVVIAILAAISIVAFTGIQQRGRDSERASDVGNISKALTTYTSDGNAWPAAASNAVTALKGYNTVRVPDTTLDKMTGTAASSSSTTTYGYTRCPATGTQTGASITWIKEQDGSTQTVKTGSGC